MTDLTDSDASSGPRPRALRVGTQAPADPLEGPGRRGRRERMAELRSAPSLLVGLGLLAAYLLAAVVALALYGPRLDTVPLDPAYVNAINAPGPSPAHPFGVIRMLGFDVFPALLRATPWDLAIFGGVLAIAAGVGIVAGAYAALGGRRSADATLTAWSDIISSVPPFFLVMLVVAGPEAAVPGVFANWDVGIFVVLFGFVLWPYYARIVRARAKQIASEPYVEAARASGATSRRLLRRHVIPNSYPSILAQIPADVANILFVLAVFPFLSCFGARVASPTGGSSLYPPLTPLPHWPFPEWGYLLGYGSCFGWSIYLPVNEWWAYVFPAGVILGFGFALALTCDGLLALLTRGGRL